MKKSIVIALILVLSIASNVFAATTPFSSVPTNHWAYSAVSTLVKAGIVDGYPDNSFQGDKAVTRYEMAQVVAKAMSYEGKINAENQTTLDKLIQEFSVELKNLGMRVDKLEDRTATLEKKASSIKFSGDSRNRWMSNYNQGGTTNGVHTDALARFQFRVRLFMNADVSENVKFDGVYAWQNQNGLSGTATQQGRNSLAQLERANFTFKNIMPNTNFTFGRMGGSMGATGVAWDVPGGWFDGGKFIYDKGNLNVMLGYGDMGANVDSGLQGVSGLAQYQFNPQGAEIGQVAWKATKDVTLYSAAIYSNSNTYRIRDTIFGVKAKMNDFTFTYDHVHNAWDFGSDDVQPNAMYSVLKYKGADAKVPGSWGLYVDYRKIGAQSIDTRLMTNNVAGTGTYAGYAGNTPDGMTLTGAKGIGYGFNYAFTKNAVMIGTVESLKSYDGKTKFNNFYMLTTNFNF